MTIVKIRVQITQNTFWAVMASGCALVNKFGTAPKQYQILLKATEIC